MTFPLIALSLAAESHGFQSLESTYRRTGPAVTSVFEEQRHVLQQSSAVMLSGRKEIAYGVVVSPDGYIVTKASEIAGTANLSVRVDTQSYPDAKVVTVDDEWDVALVQVEASGLIPVAYAPSSNIPQGSWVVANGATSLKARRALVGIVSAKIRPIPAGGGNLGIAFKEDSEETLEIEDLAEDGAAAKAGLKKGDIIVALNGRAVVKFDEVSEALKNLKPGTVVQVTYQRKEVDETVDVTLDPGPITRNDQMSGAYSDRRSGFPRVMQHDIIGDKSIVGGPLLDLDGRCVGMNIARANRAESFAIPVEDLKALAARLMKRQ
ncbi:PDZ domain-containing protein [Luteolibacter sp. SL250]|uniref:S1C family serine protease n=1 Tax=Luteolibacter sp. SL250 TaxID=2995170 RepID=UPI00226F2AFB|nr:PDZ domain-containing protein [Luteolibacter sp. SL250]WAC21429.1 PDZ domain-containing protein [Luteolibacter sp. SL250]